jgi:outer membrane protein assembly factor BamB/flagellar basal body-associated protein FliL
MRNKKSIIILIISIILVVLSGIQNINFINNNPKTEIIKNENINNDLKAQSNPNLNEENFRFSTRSSTPNIVWYIVFGENDWECGYSVLETDDGGFILVGETHSFGESSAIYLIKTNSMGTQLWNRRYSIGGINGITVDYRWAIQQTNDNGFIIAGSTNFNEQSNQCHGLLLKTDSSGYEKWNKTFYYGHPTFLWDVQQITTGEYILVGYIWNSNNGYDALLIKTNSAGDELWNKTFSTNQNDEVWSITSTSNGDLILLGATESWSKGGYDVWLIKTDKNGIQIWNLTFGGLKDDFGYSIQLTSDGGFIIVGETNSYGKGKQDIWLIKINQMGVEQWNRSFGGIEWDEGKSVQETKDGGYVLSGFTNSYGNGLSDFWIIKVDSKGEDIWNVTLGGTDEEESYSIKQTKNGSYIIVGSTRSLALGSSDVWLVRMKDPFYNQPPVAASGPDQNTIVNQTVNFNGNGSYDPNGNSLTYKWDFGDGTGTRWKNSSKASHYYNKTGNYIVTLNVSDGSLWDIDTCTIKVSNGPQLASSQWPMYMNNLQHTGLSNYDTSKNGGKLLWKYGTEGRIASSPVIGPDGTIYIGSDDYYFYAINSDGSIKWNINFGSSIHSSPAISNDGTLVIDCNGRLYLIHPNGTKKLEIEEAGGSSSSPVIGSDGIIYSSYSKFLKAFYPNGTEKWRYKIGNLHKSSPAIGYDNTIYIGSNDYFYAIYPNGTLKWKFNQGNDQIHSSPSIASDGTVYIGHDNSFAIYPNGTLKWKLRLEIGSSTAAIGLDGTIYISAWNALFAITPNGKEKWKVELKGGDSSPAIGSDGTIYVGSKNNYLCAIYPNGTEKWRFETEKSIDSSPAIGSDGTVYVGSNDFFLYAIGGNITEQNHPPIANAGPDQNITLGQPVNLDGSGSYDPDGLIITYEWTSNIDGKLGFGKLIGNILLSEGIHTITLKVSDGELTEMDTCVIRIANISENLPPIAMIKILEYNNKNYTIYLSAEDSYDMDGIITQYIWNFSDGSEELHTNKTDVGHYWRFGGNYTITLTIIDNEGARDSDSIKIVVKQSETIDSDGDGVTDNIDAFPTDAAASLDSDGDKYPDSWNPGKKEKDSTTGLKLDAYPNDSKRHSKESTDINYNFIIILIICVIIILLILASVKLFVLKSKRQHEEEPSNDDEMLSKVKHKILYDETLTEMEYSQDEIEGLLDRKLNTGQISENTYNLIKSEILGSQEAQLDQTIEPKIAGKG